MDKLGREKLWTPEVWADIDKAVLEEAGRLRTAQMVFPAQLMPDAANVPAVVFVPSGEGKKRPMIQDGNTLPFIDIAYEFALTQNQIDNEATLHTARTLAVIAARSIASAENLLFFQGSKTQLPLNVNVTNRDSAGNGLLNLQGSLQPIDVNPLPGGGYGDNALNAVSQGISALTAAGYFGPYAIILDAAICASLDAVVAKRIKSLVEERFYCTGTLQPNTGLLVNLGGNSTNIAIKREITTAYIQEDPQGNHNFRVFERVQIIPLEPPSILKLQFLVSPKQSIMKRLKEVRT